MLLEEGVYYDQYIFLAKLLLYEILYSAINADIITHVIY